MLEIQDEELRHANTNELQPSNSFQGSILKTKSQDDEAIAKILVPEQHKPVDLAKQRRKSSITIQNFDTKKI